MDIYHHALDHPGKPYSCYLRDDSALPMMILSDCIEVFYLVFEQAYRLFMTAVIQGIVQFLETDNARLTQRTYNMQAISFTPQVITQSIQKVLPGFSSVYEPEAVRQAIADSWPRSMDDSAARRDWGWQHKVDLTALTSHMLRRLKEKKAGAA